MHDRILITGGAGFVGSHLSDRLLREGYRVRVLDNLAPQVHGQEQAPPAYLDDRVELVLGDIRDPAQVSQALKGVDVVYHFAAAVGVGQSMYQVETYTDINNRGTAVLLEALIKHPVRKLVVASSMSLYGEGLYHNSAGMLCAPQERDLAALKAGEWELRDHTGQNLHPLPTPETKTPSPSSVYALSKYDQEKLCLIVGHAYGIPTVALRFFNIYGTRQALSNPYTGVLAIFSSRYLNDKPPKIFEDGLQRRDFIHVQDIAQACLLALERDEANGEVFNVGSGHSYNIREIAEKIGKLLGKSQIEPEITGQYRVGDIRHCYADISKASKILGYRPSITLDDGLAELAGWLKSQTPQDHTETMHQELASRGLRL